MNNETALHVDRNNVGPSLIVGLGRYARGRRGAGDFWVQGMEPNSPGSSRSTWKKWIEFDGNMPHGTLWEPCSQEVRFTLVYYAHKVCLQRDVHGSLQRLCHEYDFRADVEKLRLLCDGDSVPEFPAAWGPQASGQYPSRQVRVHSARNAFEAAGGKVANHEVDDYGSDTGSDPDSDCEPEPEPEPATSLQTLRQEIERLVKKLADLNAEVEQLGVEILQGIRETSTQDSTGRIPKLDQQHRQRESKKKEIAACEAELEEARETERRLLSLQSLDEKIRDKKREVEESEVAFNAHRVTLAEALRAPPEDGNPNQSPFDIWGGINTEFKRKVSELERLESTRNAEAVELVNSRQPKDDDGDDSGTVHQALLWTPALIRALTALQCLHTVMNTGSEEEEARRSSVSVVTGSGLTQLRLYGRQSGPFLNLSIPPHRNRWPGLGPSDLGKCGTAQVMYRSLSMVSALRAQSCQVLLRSACERTARGQVAGALWCREEGLHLDLACIHARVMSGLSDAMEPCIIPWTANHWRAGTCNTLEPVRDGALKNRGGSELIGYCRRLFPSGLAQGADRGVDRREKRNTVWPHFPREQTSIGQGPVPHGCRHGGPDSEGSAKLRVGAGPFPGVLVETLLLGGPEYPERGPNKLAHGPIRRASSRRSFL